MITVEDGTCVVGANSYSTLLEFKDFLNATLLNENNYTDPQLEAFLISGHVALHLRYSSLLLGSKKCTALSVIDFPRTPQPFLDSYAALGYNVPLSLTGIPTNVKTAAIWLSFIETKVSYKQMKEDAKRVKVDGLVEVEFTGSSSGSLENSVYQLVNDLMSPYLMQGGGNFSRIKSLIGA